MLDLDRIFPGDCLDMLRGMPDGCVDLVVSSPPYNIGKEYESRVALDGYLDGQGAVLAECARVLKDTGSVFWQVGTHVAGGSTIPLDVRFFPIMESLGLIPRNRIVWVRQHGLHAKKRFSGRHETILWFTKSDGYLFDVDPVRVPQKWPGKRGYKGANKGKPTCNPDGKNPGDVWLFRNVKHNHEERTAHPCQFPEDMVARIVLAASPPGGVVLDPYMGTGTVAVVARDLGRRFVAAETDPAYLEIARRRIGGFPDQDGSFANLKCLRDHAERTGVSPGALRFDVQVGKRATGRDEARSGTEQDNVVEFERRTALEEDAFGARLRGIGIPAG